MNIVHFYDGHEAVLPGEGSVPSALYYLAMSQAELGNKVTIIERKWKNLSNIEKIGGVQFIRFEDPFKESISNAIPARTQFERFNTIIPFIIDRLILALRFIVYIKKNKCDIIHIHLAHGAVFILLLYPKVRRKVFYTAHIGEEDKRLGLSKNLPWYLRLFKPDIFIFKRVKGIIVLNEGLKKKLVNLGIRSDKIIYIPLGIAQKNNLEKAKENLESITYENKKIKVILYVGTITKRKNLWCLIHAVERIKDIKTRLLLVGRTDIEQDYFKTLKSYVTSKSLNVEFTGYVDHSKLEDYYKIADVFVLPSFEEGDPVSLKEALSYGKPLLGSNIPGIAAEIRNGWNGYLFDPNNPSSLSNFLELILINNKIRVSMGKNSYRLAKKFNWNDIALQYLKFYKL